MNVPAEAAFPAGAVVGGDEDQRVVELADALERVDDSADLVVDVFHLGREDLHLAGVELRCSFGFERVPGGDLIGIRSVSFVPRRDDAQLLLLRHGSLAGLVPAHVELAAVPNDVLVRRVVRRVH